MKRRGKEKERIDKVSMRGRSGECKLWIQNQRRAAKFYLISCETL